MVRRVLLPGALCFFVACGGSDGGGSPTAPSAPPAPSTFSLTGRVTNSATGAGVGGAIATVTDGPNSGRTASTDGEGRYTFPTLQPSGFTVRVRAEYFHDRAQGVDLTSNKALDFAIQPIPRFSRAGSGNTVFDMPRHVRRVRVIATYTRRSSNFIVHIGGRGLINELLGTSWGQTRYDGLHATTGGVTEVLHSSGVQWTFTEER